LCFGRQYSMLSCSEIQCLWFSLNTKYQINHGCALVVNIACCHVQRSNAFDLSCACLVHLHSECTAKSSTEMATLNLASLSSSNLKAGCCVCSDVKVDQFYSKQNPANVFLQSTYTEIHSGLFQICLVRRYRYRYFRFAGLFQYTHSATPNHRWSLLVPSSSANT